jgi:NADH dehydrogenase (ubiquinone) 1 alpha subcomplex subunit 9
MPERYWPVHVSARVHNFNLLSFVT